MPCHAMQALSCFPYAVFALLPLDALTGTYATGYDRQGWLCKQLSLPEIREFRTAQA
jgi:hypothetical protein